MTIGFIGFGEAAQAFVSGWRDSQLPAEVFAYDLLMNGGELGDSKRAECAALGVTPVNAPRELKERSSVIIAAVTADQTLNAARSVGLLADEQIYLDIDSVSPETKHSAADRVGNGYVDVAVLSPVHPLRHTVPIVASGPRAVEITALLKQLFPNSEVVSSKVGDASLIKMIRSVFVKGFEAITVECALAAYQAGLSDRVFPSLDRVLKHDRFAALVDYNLERVATHGERRAAEMTEVCATLETLGLPKRMSTAAAEVQRWVGEQHVDVDRSSSSDVVRALLDNLK